MADRRAQVRDELTELERVGYSWITVSTKTKKASASRLKKASEITVSTFEYQPWYTRALPVIRDILPDRYDEFVSLYAGGPRKQMDLSNYRISDYLHGLGLAQGGELLFEPKEVFLSLFYQQLSILSSAQPRLDSVLTDISGVIRAEFFDDELDGCEELLRNDYLRAAGVIAGVVLERHLSSICANHSINFRKKSPTLADFNDALKKNKVLDTPKWRKIQHLGDLRNLCSHAKEREPTKEEVTELIEGVGNTIKSVF